MSPQQAAQKSANSTTATSKKSGGFSAEEMAAMRNRAKELKALTAAEAARISALVKKAAS